MILLGLTLLAIGCDRPADLRPAQQVWRFAIEESEGSVQHAYATEFERRIEQQTDGRVDVVVYPYGTLGTSTQITEQLNLGIVQFAMASPGSLGKFIPELQVFLLHFVLGNDDRTNARLLSTPNLLQHCDTLYAEKGLKLLSIYTEGEMVWTTRREIRTPDDFRGVKMRVMTSPILLDAYNSYGASATPMPYSEVYSALQLNMIDGQVNPVFAIERQKFHEVTDWLIFPRHAHFVTTAAANRPFIESLTTDDRALVEQTIEQLQGYIDGVQRNLQTERLKTIICDKRDKRTVLNIVGDLEWFRDELTESEERQLITENAYLNLTPPLSSAERAAFIERSLPVRDTYRRIGGAGAAEMLREIGTQLERIRSADAPDANRMGQHVAE